MHAPSVFCWHWLHVSAKAVPAMHARWTALKLRHTWSAPLAISERASKSDTHAGEASQSHTLHDKAGLPRTDSPQIKQSYVPS